MSGNLKWEDVFIICEINDENIREKLSEFEIQQLRRVDRDFGKKFLHEILKPLFKDNTLQLNICLEAILNCIYATSKCFFNLICKLDCKSHRHVR